MEGRDVYSTNTNRRLWCWGSRWKDLHLRKHCNPSTKYSQLLAFFFSRLSKSFFSGLLFEGVKLPAIWGVILCARASSMLIIRQSHCHVRSGRNPTFMSLSTPPILSPCLNLNCMCCRGVVSEGCGFWIRHNPTPPSNGRLAPLVRKKA
jgi:hypothetical protein